MKQASGIAPAEGKRSIAQIVSFSIIKYILGIIQYCVGIAK